MIAIVAIAALVRLPALEAQSFWFDEAYAVAIGSATWPVLFEARLVDGIHPPLFFMLMKVVLSMWGPTEFGTRFTALVPGILAIPVIYHYGRRPTHYPMQPLKPDGGWHEDADRNPLLVTWFNDHADQVIAYHHFRGIELWLVALDQTTVGSEP